MVVPSFVAPVVAQGQPDTGLSPLGEAAAAMAVTLLVGGGLILFAPNYTDRTTKRIRDRPGETLLYGIGIGIVAVVILVILFVSVVGILAAIPPILVMLVAGELGYLAAGRAVTDSWGLAVLVAMGASAVVGAVPVLGTLLGFVLSTLGMGAAYLDYRNDGRSRTGGHTGTETVGQSRR